MFANLQSNGRISWSIWIIWQQKEWRHMEKRMPSGSGKHDNWTWDVQSPLQANQRCNTYWKLQNSQFGANRTIRTNDQRNQRRRAEMEWEESMPTLDDEALRVYSPWESAKTLCPQKMGVCAFGSPQDKYRCSSCQIYCQIKSWLLFHVTCYPQTYTSCRTVFLSPF